MFTNLIELIKSMPDEQTCRNYIAEQRWEKTGLYALIVIMRRLMLLKVENATNALIAVKGCGKDKLQPDSPSTTKKDYSTEAINQVKPENKTAYVDSTVQFQPVMDSVTIPKDTPTTKK